MSNEEEVGKFVEFYSGWTRYNYETITVNGRSSLTEHQQDFQVRKELWKTEVGETVVDCGAGFGAYTLVSLANAAGFVFAFEQNSQIAAALRRNLQANRMLMATERATVTIVRLNDIESVDKHLDNLSYPINRLDWIKIDVGSIPDNRLILWGCQHSIRKFRPQILINDPEPPDTSFLSGYKISKIIQGHSLLLPTL